MKNIAKYKFFLSSVSSECVFLGEPNGRLRTTLRKPLGKSERRPSSVLLRVRKSEGKKQQQCMNNIE